MFTVFGLSRDTVPSYEFWAEREPTHLLDQIVANDVAVYLMGGLYDVFQRGVPLLYSGLQVMAPGECMTAHRHQASALRFVLEGTGAWTIVEGQKLTVGPGDFAITPNWTWHEHGNEGADDPVIWQDGLDIPLVNALDAPFYEVHPDVYQKQEGVEGSTVPLR